MHDGVGEISRLPSGVEKAPLTSFVRWWGYPPPKDAQVYVTNSPLSSGYDYARGEVLEFSKRCNPIMDYNEVMFQLNDVWNRYGTS